VLLTLRRVRAPAIAVCSAAAIAACGDASGPGALVDEIILRQPADSMFYGDTVRIAAVATGDSATVSLARFDWTSSDTLVAVVDSLGLVVGTGVGTAAVAAAFGGRTESLVVRVVLRRVDGGVAFHKLSLGMTVPVCAIAVDGSPYCGARQGEQLTTFTPLPANRGLVFTSFRTTLHSQCGLTDANLMYCWGQNAHGHFGNGSSYSFRSDTAPALGAGGRTFRALSVGGHSHACGVNAADSVVYCFGHDDLNQVGRGQEGRGDDTVVAPTGGAPRARAVTAADNRNCLVDLEEGLMCWGLSITTPTPVDAAEPFTDVRTGWGQTCALTPSRDLYCWGSNGAGETGTGSTAGSVAAPTLVDSELEFAEVFPGERATCAITPDGRLYCWGAFHPRAISSRLGERARSPVAVLPQYRFRASANAIGYGCAVTAEGQMFCFR
jgi:alpha-tubulin suppressor-like RCC1 family protein